MKLEQIKKMARDNEIATYFKELYRHSIQLLESIPDEKMTEILSKNRNVGYGDHYQVGVVDGFIFQNMVDVDDDTRYIDKVWLTVDVIYVEDATEFYPERMSLSYEESFCLDSCFDYRHMNMKLLLGKNDVLFGREYDDSDITVEDKVFLAALKEQDFLERIFGEYLVTNYGDGVFVVSGKFFED